MKYSLKKNKFGFIQVKPTPSVEELDKFYKKNFYSINYKNFNNSELKEQVKDKKFYDYKWKRILIILTSKKNFKIKNFRYWLWLGAMPFVFAEKRFRLLWIGPIRQNY